MTFAELIQHMIGAACRGDGAGVAACFAPDGVYHDVFYGSFRGRAEITAMIEAYFHRDGSDFRWDVHDPVESGGTGYARYVFSYRSRLKGCEGRRAVFEGVAICRIQNSLIADYREVANAVTGLSLMGFEDARLARFVARQAAELTARDEAASHRG
jgi:ketosteroid isomerase-like protein